MSDKRKPYIHSVKTWVYAKKKIKDVTKGIRREEIVNVNGEEGRMVVEYSDSGSHSDREEFSFPLVSVWISPVNLQDQKTCKVHAAIPQKMLTNEDELLCNLAAACKEYRGLPHNIRPEHELTVDRFMKVIRYGCKNQPYTAIDHNYFNVPIFDNKALAIQAVLDVVRKSSSAKITGIDLINMNSVPDRVLVELGFIKVPDFFGRGIPMWCGDPIRAISTNQADSYSYRSSYSSSRANKEVVDSFINILESELQEDEVTKTKASV